MIWTVLGVYLAIGAICASVLVYLWVFVEPPAEPEWTPLATLMRVIFLCVVVVLWLPMLLFHLLEMR